jgi:hypothetical protein
MINRIGLLAVAVIFLTAFAGFSVDNAIVPPSEILSGGPPKDGIPALLHPKFVAADQAKYLDEDDQVIGVVIGGVARAYPIKILTWHEAVNDTVGGQALVATF